MTTPITFSMTDPLPVTDKSDIYEYLHAWDNGLYYQPPMDMATLSKSFRSNVHHASAIYLKTNLLTELYQPSALLSRSDFRAWVLDFFIFGNAYLERINNRGGKLAQLKHAPAKYMRRSIDKFYYVNGSAATVEMRGIIHTKEPDINQEIYGLPQYLSALSSAWLNESATLFRRKYYLNGNHAGFILYSTDATIGNDDVTAIQDAFKQSKGPGNFRNMFIHAPNGKKDGIQIMPIAEATAKDEFFNIKMVTQKDVMAAHRVPHQLMSIQADNVGGVGNAIDAARIFYHMEIKPLQAQLQEINSQLGQVAIEFKPFELLTELGA